MVREVRFLWSDPYEPALGRSQDHDGEDDWDDFPPELLPKAAPTPKPGDTRKARRDLAAAAEPLPSPRPRHSRQPE